MPNTLSLPAVETEIDYTERSLKAADVALLAQECVQHAVNSAAAQLPSAHHHLRQVLDPAQQTSLVERHKIEVEKLQARLRLLHAQVRNDSLVDEVLAHRGDRPDPEPRRRRI